MLSYTLVFLSVGIVVALLSFTGTTWIVAAIAWVLLVIGISLRSIHFPWGDRPLQSDSSPELPVLDDLVRSFRRLRPDDHPPASRSSFNAGRNTQKQGQDFITGSPRSETILAILLACGMVLAAPLQAEESAPPRIQENNPPLPKIQEHKTPVLKNAETHPPELKQEPKVKDPTIEPVPNKPGRSLILTVKLALMADPRTSPYTIEVDTKGHDVVLSGKVSREAEKIAAAEVTRQVEGVKSVVSKLELVPEMHKDMVQKRDQIITEYVRERFRKSATLEAASFDIKTENGIVELSGKTRFQVIVLEAAQAARQVPGVKAVKTNAVRIENAD